MFVSRRVVSHDPFRLDVLVAPGAINDCPVPPEFDCLADPGSEWLTVPRAAALGMELDTGLPQYPTCPGNRPADVSSRFELTLDAVPRAATG